MAKLRFLGACGTVTGSKFLLEGSRRRLLVDCGVFQGSRENREKNWEAPPFEASRLDGIALTHAHIDHTGYVPRLAKLGYDGPVYATPATVGLLGDLWPDAGHLHEEDARYANQKGYSRHRPALPFFDAEEGKKALRLLRPVRFHDPIAVDSEFSFRFHRVGHILGAAFLAVESGGVVTVFSGDVGQHDAPVLKDPEPLTRADYLVLESTYGNRNHPAASPLEELGRIVEQTVARRGVLLIPAFAVGRTQDVLYHLRVLQRRGSIPADLPIFVDSPMATSVVDLYCQHLDEHDLEARELRKKGICPIEGPSVQLVRTAVESKRLNDRRGPMIIISASGMLTGGRVLHHLKRRVPEPDTTLLFVGFQAEGTLGRRILEGARDIRIHGERVPVRADIREVPALSAHADQKGLVAWAATLPSPPRKTFLVHGEPSARDALAAALRSDLGWKVELPNEGDEADLS
jgi:metallo-beta-lactamase family protein